MAAHALAAADGGEEAGFVAAIIHAHLDAIHARHVGLLGEDGHERKREETVCNGAPEGGELGFLFINMNELMIASRVGEFVDHGLIDGQPIRHPDYGARHRFQFVERDNGHSAFLAQ